VKQRRDHAPAGVVGSETTRYCRIWEIETCGADFRPHSARCL